MEVVERNLMEIDNLVKCNLCQVLCFASLM